jgi:AraC-like DNA-binding protein
MITVAIFLLYLYYPVWTDVRWAFTGLVLFIYWVSYRAWVQPELFTVVHGSGEGTQENYIPALRVHHPVKKYANSTLQPDDARSIECSLRALLEAKVYLDAGLTIDQLARQAGCNKHHLSQVLNECMGMSYHDCINSYRVEEAKTLLLDPANAGLKIAALAYEAGFNSLSSFNDVFKKVTGETPSAFRNSAAAEEVRQRS